MPPKSVWYTSGCRDWRKNNSTSMKPNRRVKVERPNVPLPYTEVLIQPFGPNGLSQLLNYDIIEFPEEGNLKSSNQIEFPSRKSGSGWMVSTPEKETLQLRALKLLTPIKGTFGLSTLTLRTKHFWGQKLNHIASAKHVIETWEGNGLMKPAVEGSLK